MNQLYKIYAYLFARPFFQRLHLHLLRFSLSGMGILNFYDNRVSGEKYFIEQVLGRLISKDPVFFDVGANYGNYIDFLSQTYPNAVIHAFEPHPKNFLQLSKRKYAADVKFNKLAIGEGRETMKLYDYEESDGSTHASLYKGVIEELHQQSAVSAEVQVEFLDNYCSREGVSIVDLLKIDVEGHELRVLKGTKNLIRKGSVKVIQFEFNEMNVESKAFMKDFFKLLTDYSFYRLLPSSLLNLDKIRYRTITHEVFAFQNIVAIHKSIDSNLKRK
ncbi:MAG: FkbM family methyltransferase [Balneolaceae bacterium]|nr:FkbM family methyltransferase [Balneolaceae bacterium]